MAYIYDLADTWNASGTTFTAIKMNVTDTASATASLLMDLQVGGSSQFKVQKNGTTTFSNGAILSAAAGLDLATNSITRSGAIAFGVSADLVILRDAANTLAQRNGVNAQAFNLYNTYTDASNYERGFMRFVSNVLTIGAEAAGTGTNRLIRFASAAPSAAWEFKSTATATPTFVLAGSDRSVTLYPQVNMLTAANGGFWSALDYATGASNQQALRQSNSNASTMFFGLIGPAAGVMQINNGSGRGAGYGASIETFEMTAPAAPPTDGVRIYAEDNGSGKTRLMALFATGAAQQIAIEP
jgi:hypothetical protein